MFVNFCPFFLSNFAAYIVCRRYKPCEFLGFVWTDCWGNKSYYVITSPANRSKQIQETHKAYSAGVKEYKVPKIERPSAHKTLFKGYAMHQCFLSRSCFTPCMSMEGGLAVMGDCQCSYTGSQYTRQSFNKNNIHGFTDNEVLAVKPCTLFCIQTLPHRPILCAGAICRASFLDLFGPIAGVTNPIM